MASKTNEPLTHSAAPWTCNSDGLIHDADGNVVAQMGMVPDRDATMANAELVTAAPDLLDALRQMDALVESLWNSVEWGKTFDLDVRALNKAPIAARAAIARAEGRDS